MNDNKAVNGERKFRKEGILQSDRLSVCLSNIPRISPFSCLDCIRHRAVTPCGLDLFTSSRCLLPLHWPLPRHHTSSGASCTWL